MIVILLSKFTKKYNYMKIVCLSILLAISIRVNAQNTINPVTWVANYVAKNATEGELVFTATIEKKWHIYSQRPTDAGPIPTSFTIKPTTNFELTGKVEETNAHEEYVPAFEAKVFVFEETAVFKQKIKLKTKTNFIVNASLEFMTCNDKQCLPPKIVELVIAVNPSKK